MLSVFQITTLENWTDGVLYPLNAKGYVGIEVFNSTIILVGGFWLVNLTITVLTSEYEKAREKQDRDKAANSIGTSNGLAGLLLHSVTVPLSGDKVVLPEDVTDQWFDEHVAKRSPRSSSLTRSITSPISLEKEGKVSPRIVGRNLIQVKTPFEIEQEKEEREKEKERRRRLRDGDTKSISVKLYLWSKREATKRYRAFNATPFMKSYRSWRSRFVEPIVSHNLFTGTIFIVILLNTIVLGVETPFQSPEKQHFLDTSNQIFTIIFAVEMVLKMIGIGWPAYFSEGWNKFDFVIVMTSLIEFLPISGGEDSALADASALRALRVFRALRVTKAVKHLKATQTIVSVFESASEEYFLFICLLALSIFITVLTGTQLFAGKYVSCAADYSEGSMDNFGSAFILIFRVLTLDDWNAIAFGGVECTEKNWVVLVYFLFWIVLGNFMLLNLFLAILIRSFEKVKEDLLKEKRTERAKESRQLAVKMALETASKLAVMEAFDKAIMNVSSSTGGLTREMRPGMGKKLVMSKRHGYFDSETRYKRSIFGPDRNITSSDELGERERASTLSPEELAEVEEVRNEVDAGYNGLRSRIFGPIARFLFRKKIEERKRLQSLGRKSKWVEDGAHMADAMEENIRAVASAGDKAHIARQLRAQSSMVEDPHHLVDAKPLSGKALFVFGHANHFRVFCHEFAHHKYFNNFIILSILTSSICLAFESPTMTDGLKYTLKALDKVFTYIFTLEMALKVVALGFYWTKFAYLKDSWNRLDFLIVVSSLVDLIISSTTSGIEIGFLKVVRLLRVLRPLRTIKRNKNLSQVVNAIIGSFMSVVNVVIIVSLITGVFAILGMGLFGGLFWQCNDANVMEQTLCNGTFTTSYVHEFSNGTQSNVELVLDREWQNYMWNFDSFLGSVSTLFIVASMEGWFEIAEKGMQVTKIGFSPDPDGNSPLGMGFFVLFICLESFMGIGLFVGVLCDYFNTVASVGGKSALITEEQKEWIEAQRSVLFSRAIPKARMPKNPIRKACWYIMKSSIFNFFVMVLIIFSIFMLSLNHLGESETWVANVAAINKVVTVLFAIEATLKIVGEGPVLYFKKWSCCFDFILVTATILDESADIAQGNAEVLFVLRIFRVFRATRILRLLGSNSGFTNLIKVLMYSLPSVWNVAVLLIMLYFTFAVLGTALFGSTNINEAGEFYNPQPAENPGVYGVGINPDANFRSFGKAFITLFRVSTGENWFLLHRDTYRDNEYGIPMLSTLYFYIFVIICQYVTLNLFVAVLLDNFNLAKSETQEVQNLRTEMGNFTDVWGIFDPDASQFIDVKQLKFVIIGLKPPLGLGSGSNVTDHDIHELLWDADIPIYRFNNTKQNKVYFKDVLYRLSKLAFGATIARDMNLETDDDCSDETLAIAALKQKRLIFSTQEYIAVKRIVKAIKRKQGKSDNLFMELVYNTVRKQNMLAEVEMEHDDYDLFADNVTKKVKFSTNMKNFAKRLGEAFKD
ncbi:hypothetical protein TrRE_jg10895 [Triparma retinervis]|uniref:Ion transport domain-containing protein n=1 Tax=Triparma retinervis TaxID=2557542 RepID=A0A9W7ANA8_9STRA|nr:hypothetical protein TrRE_jg10895 [Triparma retinervis]